MIGASLRARPFLYFQRMGMTTRALEIGPGKKRIRGFETVNVVKTPTTDHVADARTLPFADASFDLIYASHIIEHLPWYQTDDALREWARVLKPGGSLEVWTVDAYKVARLLVAYEDTGEKVKPDDWTRHGVDRDPYLWCAGRVFAYGNGEGDSSPNWHRALFTPKHLMACFERAGFTGIRRMTRAEVRGRDHGWVNLGVCGTKS